MDRMEKLRARMDSGPSRVRGIFIEAGAVSPETARPLAELRTIDPEELARLVDAGVLREAAAGCYYLYSRRVRPVAGRLIKTLVFWILVVLIPVLLIRLSK